jgi:hypothetical protein
VYSGISRENLMYPGSIWGIDGVLMDYRGTPIYLKDSYISHNYM